MSFSIGSLFDGSGGFPLAAFMCGGTPVWASEVEPYPIAVTKTRFPYMKHLGSVTDVRGDLVEPVDVITFGSPCQDLSVAGKRAGLKHEVNGDEETTRSGLFMEAVRIIKEMREATNGVYPRFALWENVPGAFSSNKGEDFRVVLEELIKIVEPSAVMPAVPKNGWPYSDHYCGDGWSLAYRVLDAQYWGVPQRRKRIYLVLDLGGQCAGEVLFEREGLRGYFEEGRTPWKAVAGDAEDCSGTADCEGNCVAYSFDALSSNSMKSSNPHSGCRQVEIAKTLDCFDPNPSKNQGGIAILEPVTAYAVNQRDEARDLGGVATALQAEPGMHQQTFIVDTHILDDQGGSQISVRDDGKCPTLRAEAHGNVPCVLEPDVSDRKIYEWHSQDMRVKEIKDDISPTLSAGMGMGGANNTTPMLVQEMRAVYPIECHTASNYKCYDAPGNGDGVIAPTITGDHNNRVTDYTAVVCCIDGDKIGKAERAGGSGLGIRDGDTMYTLTAKDVHSVCYSLETFHCTSEEEKTTTLKARDYKDPVCDAYGVGEPIALDRAYFNQGQNALYDPQLYEDGTNPTLVARGPNAVCVRYIVRRLTPTECARLQGFPDGWGHPDHKDDFTDEEYEFWLNVRNTHAEINGKVVKAYTKAQMLTWYNKLHTDSSEYKLWGNGIALPCALYVMQGIAEVFK